MRAKREAPARLLDDRDLEELTGIKRQTWAVWRMRGVGPVFLKIGRRCRYRPSDVEAFLAAREHTSTSEVSHAA